MSAAKQLKVVGEVVNQKALEWDRRVSEVIRDFVHLGELLIEGRDNQYYTHLGFDTFPDYCKSKAGISYSYATEVVKHCLVYKAIADNLGSAIAHPEIQEHVRQIGAMASINYEKRKVQKQDGSDTYVEQPVGVRNQKALADQWVRTVREFERRKAKAEKEDKRPPTFSGKFVRNMLPNEYKVTPDRGFNCNPIITMKNRLEKLHESLEQQGFLKITRLRKLAKTEPPALPVDLVDIHNQCAEVIENLHKLVELIGEIENE